MVGGTGGTIEVDLSKVPGGDGVNPKGGTKYFYTLRGVEVTIATGSQTTDITKYRKFTYNTEQKLNIGTIKHNGGAQAGFENALTNVSQVSVYYWIGDIKYSTPLLIQLGGGKTYYHYSTKDKRWKTDSFAAGSLDKALNKENCSRNEAHQLDIAQEGEASCNATGCGKKFNISPDRDKEESHNYTRYTFTPQESYHPKFLYFTHGYNIQEGLPYPGNVETVHVFRKKDPKAISLVHYNSQGVNIWYRLTDTSHTWEQMLGETIKTVDGNNADAIKELIERTYYPEVTINVGHTTNRQYDDPGKGKEKVDVYEHDFKVKEEDEKENAEYIQFTHSPNDGILFKPRAIQQGDNELGGIPISGILKTVTAYYAKSDNGYKTPLLIELVAQETNLKYYYYHKERKGAQWTLYDTQDSELKGQPMKDKLERLKNTHISRSSYRSAQTDRRDGSQDQNGDQSFNYTALWSSLVAFGAAGVIGVVVYKFWPTIKRAF